MDQRAFLERLQNAETNRDRARITDDTLENILTERGFWNAARINVSPVRSGFAGPEKSWNLQIDLPSRRRGSHLYVAHTDSFSLRGSKPGMNDNGSGVATLLRSIDEHLVGGRGTDSYLFVGGEEGSREGLARLLFRSGRVGLGAGAITHVLAGDPMLSTQVGTAAMLLNLEQLAESSSSSFGLIGSSEWAHGNDRAYDAAYVFDMVGVFDRTIRPTVTVPDRSITTAPSTWIRPHTHTLSDDLADIIYHVSIMNDAPYSIRRYLPLGSSDHASIQAVSARRGNLIPTALMAGLGGVSHGDRSIHGPGDTYVEEEDLDFAHDVLGFIRRTDAKHWKRGTEPQGQPVSVCLEADDSGRGRAHVAFHDARRELYPIFTYEVPNISASHIVLDQHENWTLRAPEVTFPVSAHDKRYTIRGTQFEPDENRPRHIPLPPMNSMLAFSGVSLAASSLLLHTAEIATRPVPQWTGGAFTAAGALSVGATFGIAKGLFRMAPRIAERLYRRELSHALSGYASLTPKRTYDARSS